MSGPSLKRQEAPEKKAHEALPSKPVEEARPRESVKDLAQGLRGFAHPGVLERRVETSKAPAVVAVAELGQAREAESRKVVEAGQEAVYLRLDQVLEARGRMADAQAFARAASLGHDGLPGLLARVEKRSDDPQVVREAAASAEFLLRTKLPDECYRPGPSGERDLDPAKVQAFLASAQRTMEGAWKPGNLDAWREQRTVQVEAALTSAALEHLQARAAEGRGPLPVVQEAYQARKAEHTAELAKALGNAGLAEKVVAANHAVASVQAREVHQVVAEAAGAGAPGSRVQVLNDAVFYRSTQEPGPAQQYLSAACEAQQGGRGAAARALDAWQNLEAGHPALAQAFQDRGLDPDTLRLALRAEAERILEEDRVSPSGPVVQTYLQAAKAFREGAPGASQAQVAEAWMKVNLENDVAASLLRQRGLDPTGLRLVGQTTQVAHDPVVVRRAEALVRNIPGVPEFEAQAQKGWCVAGGPFKVPGAERADWAVFRRADDNPDMIRVGVPHPVTGVYQDVFKGPVEGLKDVDPRAYKAALYASKVDPYVAPGEGAEEPLRRNYGAVPQPRTSYIGGLATVHVQQQANASPELMFGGFRMIGGVTSTPPAARYRAGASDLRWSPSGKDVLDLSLQAS